MSFYEMPQKNTFEIHGFKEGFEYGSSLSRKRKRSQEILENGQGYRCPFLST